MVHLHITSVFSIFLISCSSLIHAQQPYVRKATTKCDRVDNSTSVLGYTCNGISPICQTYLTFRSHTPFDSVTSISNLLSADPSQLSALNSVVKNATFEPNRMVLVPVNCSCSGEYYQANTSYVVKHEDTRFLITNNTFQGLSTCQAIRAQNSNLTRNIYSGTKLIVPLRCACPTKNQSHAGVNYLLSYLVTWGESVSIISAKFGVDIASTLEANGLPEQDPAIYPFTTLLVPLQKPPSSSHTAKPPPPPSLPPSSSTSSSKTWVYVLVTTFGGLAIVSSIGVSVFCVFFCRSKKKEEVVITSDSFKANEKQDDKMLDEETDFLESISSIAQSLKVYSLEELQSATENFSPSCLIKGSVYRGTINGDFAAIKKTNGDVSKEINLLNKISHINLILLSGICFNEGHWYLVYEYAANGPLSNWIYYNSSDQMVLNWTKRIQIALDVATGLSYLHSCTSPPYVHRDLKASNVLLDSDFRAKITNFNLARSAEGQEGQFALTMDIVGTKGYMAPEYLENGLVSSKLDVYAFGVLMMEILSGKEVAVLYEGVKSQLAEVLVPVLHEEEGKENLRNFMDHSLQGNYPIELAMFVARLTNSCIKKDPLGRPEMREIVQILSRSLTTSLSWELSVSIEGYHSLRTFT